MSSERWEQIQSLYLAALDREPRQRPAFLDAACAGDQALRREVESLLDQQHYVERFIEAPALEVVAKALAENQSGSMLGQQIAAYKILDPLGSGGMGEVYRACDTRLDRIAALKVLPVEV